LTERSLADSGVSRLPPGGTWRQKPSPSRSIELTTRSFNAVCALLLEEGRRFEKHSGVRAAFNQHFVKSGRLARKHGDLYNRLFRNRQEGDYVEFTKFDDQYVGEQIKGCEEFLGQIRPLIKTLAENK
jgi:uncharacterized protein (UPF0332 family)